MKNIKYSLNTVHLYPRHMHKNDLIHYVEFTVKISAIIDWLLIQWGYPYHLLFQDALLFAADVLTNWKIYELTDQWK